MDLFDVHRREKSLCRRQPQNPVVDVLVVPRRRPRQRVRALLSHGERQSGFVSDALFAVQAGVAARQEVEVVERREAVVARDGGLRHDVAAPGKQAVGEEGRDDWRPGGSVHGFAHDDRQAQPLRGTPLGRQGAVEFDASLVIADDGLVALLADDVLVGAFDEVLVCRQPGREEPFAADGILSVSLPVEGVDPAPRTGHGLQDAVALVAPVVVGRPRMHVSGFRRRLPVPAVVVPREDAAQGVFALAVFELRVVGVVGRQQGQFPVGIDVPGVQPEAVAFPGVVVDLLQHVHVVERAALVAFGGIVRPDDVHLVVVDVLLLVAVAVLVVVGRGLVDGAG